MLKKGLGGKERSKDINLEGDEEKDGDGQKRFQISGARIWGKRSG